MENQRTFPHSFGELLKVSRQRQHLTQKHLAQQLGVHTNTISSWELGTYLPATRGLVLELARHLALNESETRHLLEASLIALPPHWHVPFPRNPLFTGREEILEALRTRLHTDQMTVLTQSYALHGLGGIGKTQIALEYAYRYVLEYSAVFWIRAETSEHIVSDLLHIAEVLQLPERDDHDQQRVVAATQRWLTTHSQWLLIWDNLEEMELLLHFLPPIRQGAILITTRCQAFGTLAQGIDLEPMRQEEGILFVLRRAKVLAPEATHEHMQRFAESMPEEYAAATELVTAMAALPLALDQAGAYIEETGCSLMGYRQRYEQQSALLLNRRGLLGGDHPHSVSATFRLASERIERGQSVAADVLHVCAFLHADAIPEEVFIDGAVHLGPELASLTTDPAQFDQTIAVLRSLSLVQRQAEAHTFSLHRLVQAVLRARMSEQEQHMWLRRVIAALNTVFPEVTFVASTSKILRQCRRFFPHVLVVAGAIPDQAGSQALVEVLRKAAEYLRWTGTQHGQAEALYQRALRIGEQTLEPHHPELATALAGLARLYRMQGKYGQAEASFQRALCIREQTLGPGHPLMADLLHSLASLYWTQGKYEPVEPLYQRALHIREQTLGPEHPDFASSFTGLATLYKTQGKYEQAEPLYQRALNILRLALGPEHPWVAMAFHNLADLYAKQGKDEQAEPLFRQALRIWEQNLGPEHPDVAYPLNSLADLYARQGRDKQAESLYQRALRITEQALGLEHPLVADPLNGLADLYAEQGKQEQAEPLYKRVLRITEQALGAEHPDLASSLNRLANLFREQGKDAEAEPLYQRALSIRELHLGQHPETAETLHDLALFYQKLGNLCQALSLAERALSIRSQSLGDTHPKTVATRTLSAQLLQEQAGAAERVVPPLHKALHPPRCEDASLQEFLDACCEFHPRAWCRSADLWQIYGRWGEEHQERFPLSRRAFIAQLKAHGCRADRTNTARIWRGITIVKKTP